MGRVKVFLNDRKLRKLEKKLAGLVAKRVQVGIVEGAGNHSSGISMAELAAIHLFGAPSKNIPARDFLRAPLEAAKSEQIRITTMVAKSITHTGMSIEKGLDVIGIWGEATIKAAMRSGDIKPSNAPSTVARKGSSTPLVDTGELHDAISHKVK